MVDALFEALGSHPGVNVIDLINLSYGLCDDQLLVSGATTLLRMLGATEGAPKIQAFVDDIVSRLRDRDLYVSSLSFLPKYPEDPWEADKSQQRGLDQLASDCKNEQALAKLRADIAAELTSIPKCVPDAVGRLSRTRSVLYRNIGQARARRRHRNRPSADPSG